MPYLTTSMIRPLVKAVCDLAYVLKGNGKPGDEPMDYEVIAELFYGLYGDEAIEKIEQVLEKSGAVEKAWNASDHPRGKNGRFIPKGSAEAVSSAQEAVRKVMKGDYSVKPQEIADHLSILTMKQIRALAAEHGRKVPRVLKADLIESVKALVGQPAEPKAEAPRVEPKQTNQADDDYLDPDFVEEEEEPTEGKEDWELTREQHGHSPHHYQVVLTDIGFKDKVSGLQMLDVSKIPYVPDDIRRLYLPLVAGDSAGKKRRDQLSKLREARDKLTDAMQLAADRGGRYGHPFKVGTPAFAAFTNYLDAIKKFGETSSDAQVWASKARRETNEFYEKVSKEYANGRLVGDVHHHLVETALLHGKPVPDKVLADYPDLAEKYKSEDTGKPAADATTPDAKGDEVSDKGGSVEQVSDKQKKDVEYVRAPSGGAVSDVNGVFYPGGQLMPIHGAYAGEEKSKPGDGKSVGDGPATRSDKESDKRSRGSAAGRGVFAPEDAKRKAEDQAKWNEMRTGPLGKMLWFGDSPNQKTLYQQMPAIDGWSQYVEQIGKDGVNRIIGVLEPEIHAAIGRTFAEIRERDRKKKDEGRWSDVHDHEVSDDMEDWHKENLRNEAIYDAEMTRKNRLHEKKNPGSHYARRLVAAFLDQQNHPGERLIDVHHRLNTLLSAVATGDSVEQVSDKPVKNSSRRSRIDRDEEGNVRAILTLPDGSEVQGRWRVDKGQSESDLVNNAINDYASKLHLKVQNDSHGSRAESVEAAKGVTRQVQELLDHLTGGKSKDVIADFESASGGRRVYRVEPRYDRVSGVHFVGVYDHDGTTADLTPKHESYEDASVDVGTHLANVRDPHDLNLRHPATKSQYEQIKREKTESYQREREESSRIESEKRSAAERDYNARQDLATKYGKTPSKKGYAKVVMSDGSRQNVEGVSVGEFVVHKEENGRYTVSHKGSGLGAARNLATQSEAKTLAAILASRGKWDFSETDKADKKTLERGGRIIGLWKNGAWGDLLDYLNSK